MQNSSKKIGLFRIITAIFGGLIASYLGVTFLVIILPFDTKDTAVFGIFATALAWAIFALWISLSYTKLTALLRFIVPTIIFSISIYFLN